VVSHAAVQAGGHVHGVIPRALITRASETTASPANGDGKASEPVPGEVIRSAEGKGKDLLDDDYDGRLSMQVTSSMHDVSRTRRFL